MKKNTFKKTLEGLLLLAILMIVLVLVGVFMFDKYASASSSYNNKYADDFFEKQEGFIHYKEYNDEAMKNYLRNSAYKLPYSKSDTIQEKIAKVRYLEELNVVLEETNSNIAKLEKELKDVNDVFTGSIGAWLLQVMLGYCDGTASSINSHILDNGYTKTADDIKNTFALSYSEGTNIYDLLKTDGYTGSITTFMSYLLNESLLTDSYYSYAVTAGFSGTNFDWIIKVLALNGEKTSAYQAAKAKGLTLTIDEWYEVLKKRKGNLYYDLVDASCDISEYELMQILYNDTTTDNTLTAYKAAVTIDTARKEQLIAALNPLYAIIKEAEDRNLEKWEVYYSDTLMGFQKMMANDKYEFYLNIKLTTFKVVELETGNVWYSNPQEINNENLRSAQNTVIRLFNGKTAGAQIPYSNYDFSVSSTDSYGRDVTPNFSIKLDKEKNTLLVWYRMESRSVDYTYFPNYISVERINELLKRNAELVESGATMPDGSKVQGIKDGANLVQVYAKWLQSYYKLVEADSEYNEFGFDYYEYNGKISAMSALVCNNLYKWMYGWCSYTAEDLVTDNTMFGIDTVVEKPSFTVALEYVLTDQGLQVSVPGNSIEETNNYKIVNMDILPYFTSTQAGIEGYTIVPDGSGAVINHDNGKTNFSSYSKRFFTQDLAMIKEVKTAQTEDLLFPMYAVVNQGNSTGVLVEAYQMAAQLELRVDVSGRGALGESNNTNYFNAYLRESQLVYIGTYSKNAITKYTNERNSEDIILNYTFLDKSELSYSAVAKKYREILVDRYDITEKDDTSKPVLDLDILGAYSFRNNFAGIGYTDKDTLTTYEQLLEMIKKYQAMGIEDINIFYDGWRDEGLVQESFEKIKISKLLGSKKELKALIDENNKVTIYPYVNTGEVNKYQESFGSSHYTSRNVIGEVQVRYPFDLALNIFDKTKKKINVISPRYYYAFVVSLVDSYTKTFGTNSTKKNAINLNSIAIDSLGSALAGDYKKGIEFFKSSAIKEQVKALNYCVDNGVSNIALYAPYEYALQYASYGKDVPFQSTQYEIIDYSIPFYQLVVNGLFDYSGQSINANSEIETDIQIMRLLETGSNPNFLFTYDSSEKLLTTDYNYYYYTHYEKWLKDVEYVYNVLLETGIYGLELISHERIQNNVFKVTYSDGTKTISYILNYTLNEVTYNGIKVPAKYYKLLG